MERRTYASPLARRVLFALVAATTFAVTRLDSKEVESIDAATEAYRNIALFTRALEQIRMNYVDGEKVSYEELIQGAIRGMIGSLDEHSQFLDKDAYQDMQEDTRGQFGGLGIVISMKDNALTIVSPMEDTPGFRAGLLPDDRILQIDATPAEGLNLADAVKLLRGEPGSKVTLKVLRPKTREVRELVLERADIKVASVKDAQVLEDGIGYVRITQFNEPTAAALELELKKLQDQDVRALILDLRNNPGGLLRSAIEVSQKFLRKREVVVSTKGRNPRDDQVYRAGGRDRVEGIPMVVLVNGGSASASEIVAGALQDHRRAVLIGEKTFGKGSVQSVLQMSDETALRLTTARYYTPSNRMIHEQGIEPDIVVPMPPEDWRSLMLQKARKENPAAMEAADVPPGPDVQDFQLERARSVLKGILLYQARANR